MATKRRDPDIPKLRKALRHILPDADVTIKDVPYGDFLHVYVRDERFAGLSEDERDELVWVPLKQLLPPEITLRISMCWLLAPDEEPWVPMAE